MVDAQERVTVSVTDGVAEVRMNRPDKRNAFDPAMFEALINAGEALKQRAGLRAVVLSGAGPDFCAGLDFGMFEKMRDGQRLTLPPAGDPPADSPAQKPGHRVVWVWAELPVPVIAAVHGHALGAGLQLTLGADIRIVSPDARLGVFEVLWGLIPDMTGTQLLPDLIGRDKAKELTFTGRIVTGREAVDIGLATRVADDPRAEALAMAREIAQRSPDAVRAGKRLLDLAGRADLATGFAAELAEIGRLISSPNQVEAVAARLEQREPRFVDP
jgi:enoyl-CoA hydratase/carnithine racemase